MKRIIINCLAAISLYSLCYVVTQRFVDGAAERSRAKTSFVVNAKANGSKVTTNGLVSRTTYTENGTWIQTTWNTGEKEFLFVPNPIHASTYKIGVRYKNGVYASSRSTEVFIAMLLSLFPFLILWTPLYSLLLENE